jgi:hypothetical protein
VDYFKTIDSKDKAYWLGFLYADGGIIECSNNSLRLSIELACKDENWLDRFLDTIHADKECKTYRKSKRTVRIDIYHEQFVRNLISNGCVPRKSAIIELPELPHELLKAFVLGYFDGDGNLSGTTTTKSATVVCASRHFLEQIQQAFSLSNDIRPKKNAFVLTIDIAVFRDLLRNFGASLPRKRLDSHSPKNSRMATSTSIRNGPWCGFPSDAGLLCQRLSAS